MIQEAFASPTRAHAKRQRTYGLVASLAAVSDGLIALGYTWFSYNPEQTSAIDYDYRCTILRVAGLSHGMVTLHYSKGRYVYLRHRMAVGVVTLRPSNRKIRVPTPLDGVLLGSVVCSSASLLTNGSSYFTRSSSTPSVLPMSLR